MPLTSDQQAALAAAIDRCLHFYDGDHAYNAAQYPGAFRQFGSVVNFVPALKDVATIMQLASVLVNDATAAAASSPKALRVDSAQSFTDGEKAQAIANLALSKVLRGDIVQSFSAAELTQLLANIGLSNGGLVPPGALSHFSMVTPPAGWLKANGASLSRASYPALFAAIGTTYGSADGNSFSLPDLRGYFLRVLDDGRGVDSGRTLGSGQASQNLAHAHGPSQNGLFITNGSGANVGSGDYLGVAGATSTSGGAEARPVNIAMPIFIKT